MRWLKVCIGFLLAASFLGFCATVSFDWSPKSGIMHGQSVQFYNTSDPRGGKWEWILFNYECDNGDRKSVRIESTQENPRFTLLGEGNHQVTLRLWVWDSVGDYWRYVGEHTEMIYVGAPAPSCDFTVSPASPEVGETVWFRDRSSTNNPPICLSFYLVDDPEGNRTRLDGLDVSFTFEKPGTYRIKHIIKDSTLVKDMKTIFLEVGGAPPCASNQLPPNITNVTGPMQYEDKGTGVFPRTCLAWSATDPEGDPLIYDVYFGSTPNPPLARSGVTYIAWCIDRVLPYDTTFYWKVVAKDTCHPEGVSSPVWSFRTPSAGDTEPPDLELNRGSLHCGSTGGEISFAWSATDNVTPSTRIKFRYRLDGKAWSPWSTSWHSKSYSGLANGSHQFEVEARDEAGNTSSRHYSFVVNCASEPPSSGEDRDPPTLRLSCGTLRCGSSGGEISFSWLARDNVTPSSQLYYRYKLDEGDWSGWSHRTNKSYSSLSEGSHTFYVEARDKAGNTTRKSCGFTVACSACSCSISPKSVQLSASGGTGTVSVSVPDGCSWTAISNASWIIIDSSSKGTGNGLVEYSVKANPSPNSRSGTININDETFTVVQEGTPSKILLSEPGTSSSEAPITEENREGIGSIRPSQTIEQAKKLGQTVQGIGTIVGDEALQHRGELIASYAAFIKVPVDIGEKLLELQALKKQLEEARRAGDEIRAAELYSKAIKIMGSIELELVPAAGSAATVLTGSSGGFSAVTLPALLTASFYICIGAEAARNAQENLALATEELHALGVAMREGNYTEATAITDMKLCPGDACPFHRSLKDGKCFYATYRYKTTWGFIFQTKRIQERIFGVYPSAQWDRENNSLKILVYFWVSADPEPDSPPSSLVMSAWLVYDSGIKVEIILSQRLASSMRKLTLYQWGTSIPWKAKYGMPSAVWVKFEVPYASSSEAPEGKLRIRK